MNEFNKWKTLRLVFLGILILCLMGITKPNKSIAEHQIIQIKSEDIIKDITGSIEEFPKYTTQLMNLANQNAQATRPKHVGQMSELIQEFPGKSYEEWVKWYEEKYPHSIDHATEKIYQMLQNFRQAMDQIDKAMIRRWVQDLVLTKTYAGLKFHDSIIKTIAAKKKEPYRLATAEEEAKGIDGYIGNIPVAISPVSYRSKKMLPEKSDIKMIYYEKSGRELIVYYDF